MKKPKVGKSNNNVFSIFAGERVALLTKTKVSESLSSGREIIEKSVPLSIEGFLLDCDENYYYLGETADAVSAAVAVSQVILIQEIKSADVYTELLEAAETGNMN